MGAFVSAAPSAPTVSVVSLGRPPAPQASVVAFSHPPAPAPSVVAPRRPPFHAADKVTVLTDAEVRTLEAFARAAAGNARA